MVGASVPSAGLRFNPRPSHTKDSKIYQYICNKSLDYDVDVNPLSPNSRSNANFSFQCAASYVWYSMENLAGDLLLGLKFD